ncbi:Rcf2p [Ascoidea rubescens DSM 1968]|uniref:Altered inheritance rate of mitochondria protein 38 n=1 Tax=Ascoidea rubescens DSM 1968 TaxID=1344418 RepID=A0A1D2VMR5_9ASCO|nr:altered inheritance rate of mitochondria protein 38 [Ascoidea rubescens DSM 1968]ODV62857.1 altered inheritance rate of mitochondria protein 38 [Ascoidea rubescens DSM 1968]
MKILSEDEKAAHSSATFWAGFKGGLAGAAISALLFTVGAKRWPVLHRLPTAAKTAVVITPPTLLISICAEEGSNNFDKIVYSSEHTQQTALKEYLRWQNLSYREKTIELVSSNRYSIIVGAWAASLYGSWALVNRDPIMTKPQKIVQARMYAQFLTVALLLGSIGLTVWEENNMSHTPQAHKIEDSWKDILADEEDRERKAGIPLHITPKDLHKVD